jgi:DNA invertase Pin-like site-specific DNA recombinase
MALHKDHQRDNCREDNLYWGTRQNNADDMVTAGRQAHNKPNAKLTEQDVLEIRRLNSEEGIIAERLATRFGIKACTVSNILNRKTWRNI